MDVIYRAPSAAIVRPPSWTGVVATGPVGSAGGGLGSEGGSVVPPPVPPVVAVPPVPPAPPVPVPPVASPPDGDDDPGPGVLPPVPAVLPVPAEELGGLTELDAPVPGLPVAPPEPPEPLPEGCRTVTAPFASVGEGVTPVAPGVADVVAPTVGVG